MERQIRLSDFKTAVLEAYNNHKSDAGGKLATNIAEKVKGKFGISLRLVDGSKFDIGDTQAGFALGAISRIPIFIQLLTQMKPQELIDKMMCGQSICGCCCSNQKPQKPPKHIKGMHIKGVRAASLVEPIGDFDGKMKLISILMTDLMGSSPKLDYTLYEAARKESEDKNIVNAYAETDNALYDDSPLSIDLYNRLCSMLATTEQLAEMGATIAADGINPVTKTAVFDSALSPTVIAMIAAKGPKHVGKPWLILTGLPSMSSFGGGFISIIPGLGSLAAYSPELNEAGIPIKASRAIKEIANHFNLNAFSSSRIVIEK